LRPRADSTDGSTMGGRWPCNCGDGLAIAAHRHGLRGAAAEPVGAERERAGGGRGRGAQGACRSALSRSRLSPRAQLNCTLAFAGCSKLRLAGTWKQARTHERRTNAVQLYVRTILVVRT
jgi:hypothetical protein